MQLVPIHDFDWGSDLSTLKEMTCRNHTDARYLTKNPWLRQIHVTALPKGDIERSQSGECVCPFSDLMVIVKETDSFTEAFGPRPY